MPGGQWAVEVGYPTSAQLANHHDDDNRKIAVKIYVVKNSFFVSGHISSLVSNLIFININIQDILPISQLGVQLHQLTVDHEIQSTRQLH